MAIGDEQLIDAGLRTGLIEASQIDTLRQKARKQRSSALAMVLAHYRVPVSALYRAVAQQQGVDFVELSVCRVDTETVKKLPASLLRRKLLLPVTRGEQRFLVVANPMERASIEQVQRLMGQSLPLAMADVESLRREVERSIPASTLSQAAVNPSSQEQPDVVALLDAVLREAYLHRASDIHFLSEENGLRVRFRVDGKLRDHPIATDKNTANGLISRVKVLSDLDIAEQRQPQDGGFSYQLPAPFDKEFSIRVATAPTRLGERITMRVLGEQSATITLTDLGMLPDELEQFRKAIHTPFGMILLTGPTGSGKSTTLFAALQEINAPDVNIMTVENPIEYVMEGVSQLQTGPKVSFAGALRSFLRHDPDVLMVGEIRDHETADVAVKAAMTGHLVFSTLHTNNAVSAVTRLIDIGCESFLIGSTMTAVIAQRLVRRLCSHCKKPRKATETELAEMGMAAESETTIYDSVGCALCQGTGFSGRLGLYETLWFNEKLARLVARGADEETIEQEAGEASLQFLWQDGVKKIQLGWTTLNEVRNVAVRKYHQNAELV